MVPIDDSLLLWLAAAVAAFMMLLAAQAGNAAAAKRLPAPKLTGPAEGASVKVAPTFEWSPVKRAARYEFQFAADDKFESIVGARRDGSFKTRNTFATVPVALADSAPGHGYFWRVRAIDAKDGAGRWSAARKVVKSWPDTPELLEPADGAGASIGTANPTVLRWTRVPLAFKYRVRIAKDPDLATVVIGDRRLGVVTSALEFALPGSLASGEYYWDVTPMDSDRHTGRASDPRRFVIAWNDRVDVRFRDLAHGDAFNVRFGDDTADALPWWTGSRLGLAERRVVDPQLSWGSVQGAASYEVEINFSSDFAAGSRVCCDDVVTGTSISPVKLLPNNTYFTRVRAVDPDGNAGRWYTGPSFRKSFDLVCLRDDGSDCVTQNDACVEAAGVHCLPTVPRLVLHDNLGAGPPAAGPSGPAMRAPVVEWSPVAGASSYEVSVEPWEGGTCIESGAVIFRTASTAWTPLGKTSVRLPRGPLTSSDTRWTMTPGESYCIFVRARSDRDAKLKEIPSQWTKVGAAGQATLTYGASSSCSTTGKLSTPASAYRGPAAGAVVSRAPLFTWTDVAGACGYFVVVARDPEFTQLVDVAFTRVPAYAPRTGGMNVTTYADEQSAYYWAVMPTRSSVDDDKAVDILTTKPEDPDNHPQAFHKRSAPPQLVVFTTAAGQPEFSWSAVEGARRYHLQVDDDPSFGSPLDEVTTGSTSFTSTRTYPADSHLYWRVGADDENLVGLTWSDTADFQRSLPPVEPKPMNGSVVTEIIPRLEWKAAERAVFYEVHVEQVDGTKLSFRTWSTALTPIVFAGKGVWKWRVRAHFRSGTTDVGGPWSGWQYITRHIATPLGIKTVKRGRGIALSWAPAPMGMKYRVEIAADDSFTRTLERATTSNISYAPKMSSPGFDGGKPLYWRVATIDEGNNIGGWATTAIRHASTMRIQLSKRGRRAVLVRVKDGKKKAVKGALVRVTARGMTTIRKRTGRRGTVTVKLRGAKRGKALFHVEKRGYAPKDVKFRVR